MRQLQRHRRTGTLIEQEYADLKRKNKKLVVKESSEIIIHKMPHYSQSWIKYMMCATHSVQNLALRMGWKKKMCKCGNPS